jgi:hypothetical protein
MRSSKIAALLFAAVVLAASCGEKPETPQPLAEEQAAVTAPADAFLARIAQHCGQSFAGRIIANEPPPTTPDPFTDKALVMHVRECSDKEIRIPFHVGDDHSRTWILTRTESGLRLKHDHRHEDGTEDDVTMYGGDTATPGTEVRQEFPVDQDSIRTFGTAGLTASVINVWAMEIVPGERFVYELARPGTDRMFRVEFDLTTPVPTPPTPWGHPALEGDGTAGESQ